MKKKRTPEEEREEAISTIVFLVLYGIVFLLAVLQPTLHNIIGWPF